MSEMQKKLLKRWSALKNERSPFVTHWMEISSNIIPRNGRFLGKKDRDGGRDYNKIYDSTASRALDILSAGLMGGLTSPSRPWFKLACADERMNEHHAVKVWLSEVERMMQTVFQRSNVYGSLHHMYEELAAFGTAVCVVLPDYNDVIRCYPMTAGEYAIASNWRGEVDTLYREFDKTVAELVEEFGKDNVSMRVLDMYKNGQYDEWVTVIHAIEPRRDADPSKKDVLNMPFRSVYIEKGGETDKILRESGFVNFPAICPRWTVSGGNIYGSSPAMKALGDVKQLQHQQLRKSTVIDYQTNPPLVVPESMKARENDYLPGGVSYYDSATGGVVQTAFNVNLNLSHLLQDIEDVRARINSSFYADLFLMISGADKSNMTATEVAERHEEKMLMLGPVLERLQNELIDPLISITFAAMSDAGILPPPPEELQGSEVNVVLMSILAQAQRSIGINTLDRFIGSIGSMASIKPEVLDNLDADSLVKVYAESLGVDPRVLASPVSIQALRESRAQQAEIHQQIALAEQGAGVAETLAHAQVLGGQIQ